VLAGQFYLARHVIADPFGQPAAKDGVAIMKGSMLVCCFLYGVLFYQFKERIPYNRPLFFVCLILAFLCMSAPQGFPFAYPFICYSTVYIGFLNPPKAAFARTGDYSYGLYLYGFFPLQQMIASLGDFTHVWYINLVLVMPCAALLAYFSWNVIDKPALKLRSILNRVDMLAPFKGSMGFGR
jgi:peptidoglycan/LPS O-acetylase OafA/YrhL